MTVDARDTVLTFAEPKIPDSALVCIMAKVPETGRVKTRLCPPLKPEQAAALARAFLSDTWAELQRLQKVRAVLCYAGDVALLPAELNIAEDDLWPQPVGDLGARMEYALARGLAQASRVALIGSDAPALPAMLIARALDSLSEADAVLGPSLDGGYYLLATRRHESGLLANLPWSAPNTLRATYQRLRRRGYRVARLPVWFDVDDRASLTLLQTCLRANLVCAPATALALSNSLLRTDSDHS